MFARSNLSVRRYDARLMGPYWEVTGNYTGSSFTGRRFPEHPVQHKLWLLANPPAIQPSQQPPRRPKPHHPPISRKVAHYSPSRLLLDPQPPQRIDVQLTSIDQRINQRADARP